MDNILDKIRTEIEDASYEHYFEFGEYIGEDCKKVRIINFDDVLKIIDKYKVESEDKSYYQLTKEAAERM